MAIANTVAAYLHTRRIPYELIMHPYRETARQVAESAHVPPAQVAKGVILSDSHGGYVMAVIPSDCHVDLNEISRRLGRRLELAPEMRLAPVFRDCASGAVPPVGPAYGMETIVDDALVGLSEIYFESGDHRGLIHVSGDQFLSLLREASHGWIAH